MGKTKQEGEEPAISTLPAEDQPVYQTNRISTDEGNGIIVFSTEAPDGTGFTAKIDGETIEASAENGQVWFYAGRPLRAAPIVELL